MKYHFLRSKNFIRLKRLLILAIALTFAPSNQNVQSQTNTDKILKISPAKLVKKVRQKIQENPRISATEVTALANLQRFRNECSGNAIAGMDEPPTNIGEGDLSISAFEGKEEMSFRPRTNTAKFSFDFRNTFFFGIKIRGVSG